MNTTETSEATMLESHASASQKAVCGANSGQLECHERCIIMFQNVSKCITDQTALIADMRDSFAKEKERNEEVRMKVTEISNRLDTLEKTVEEHSSSARYCPFLVHV